ncbi:two-component system sensor kinase [Streptomyces formicae]|uniref:histidine kinase n=1 Tax=Streptomyces formicae TaxID=1616117 RepID=A0A291Q1P7_9ACTN|nr:two-component system sensor kinase [Streptomyces formicae]
MPPNLRGGRCGHTAEADAPSNYYARRVTRRTPTATEPAIRACIRRWLDRWGLPLLSFLLAVGAFFPIDGRPVPHVQGELGLTPWPALILAGLIAVSSVIAVRVLPGKRWPVIAVGCASWVLTSVWATLCVSSYVVGSTVRRPLQQMSYVAGASVITVLPTAMGLAIGLPGVFWGDVFSSMGGAGLFVWLPFALGLWNKARRDVVESLHERAEQLEREQATRAEQARLQERARIARDMHDVVAHRVSLMVLHAGALEINAKDEETALGAELIRTTGREALAQLRDVIGVLKASDGEGIALGPQPTLVDLERLLNQSRAAGMSVRRVDGGTPQRLPTLLEHAAYRLVQESLTNVHKHAGAADTEVVVRYHEHDLEIAVHNEAPTGPVELLPGSGMGLLGLRERVELLDGEFTAEPRPGGGFSVRARLPIPAPDTSTDDAAAHDSATPDSATHDTATHDMEEHK